MNCDPLVPVKSTIFSSVDVLVVLCLYILLSVIKMPTRAYKRRQRRKGYYEDNKWLNDGGQAEMSIDSTHSQTPTQYSGETENREEVVIDEKHKELNRARVRRSRQRRLGDAVYAEQERKRILAAVKNHLLADDTYREQNRKRARITTKNRLQTDDSYREQNRKRARITTKNRLQTDDAYREQNRKQARIATKKRLQTDDAYREQNRKRATITTKNRRQTDDTYREQNRKRARITAKNRWLTDEKYRELNAQRAKAFRQTHAEKIRLYNKKWYSDERNKRIHCDKEKQRYQTDNQYRLHKIEKTAQSCRTTPDTEPAQRRILTRQQKYWIRRSKLLAAGRLLESKLKQQKRMMKDCNTSLLDVKMLFHKADVYLNQACLRQKLQHKRLVSKIDDFRKQLGTDNKPTEDDITRAFGDRQHTSTTEPYFWEQSYQPAHITDAVAVDSDGRAHYFKHFTRRSTSCDLNSDATEDNRKETECWQCHPLICSIEQDVVDGVVSLMEKVSSVQLSRCCAFYQHIDSCTNPTRSDALGHPVYCQFDVNCKSLQERTHLTSVA